MASPKSTKGIHRADRLLKPIEASGEFIDENGGGPGVRLRKRHQKKN
jgi:hypothetical protein